MPGNPRYGAIPPAAPADPLPDAAAPQAEPLDVDADDSDTGEAPPAVSLETWYKRIKAARRRREQHRDRWALYTRMHIRAEQYRQGVNDDIDTFLPEGDRVTLGLVHRNVEQTLATLELPEIGVRVTSDTFLRPLDDGDTHRESVIEFAIIKSLNRSGLIKGPEYVDEIKRDAIMVGHGINYTSWRTVHQPQQTMVQVFQEMEDGSVQPMLDESGEPQMDPYTDSKVIWDAVQDRRISPLDFLFEASAKSIPTAGWHGDESVIMPEGLREMGIEPPEDVPTTSFTVQDLYQLGQRQDEETEDGYKLIRIWDKVNRELIYFLESCPGSDAGAAAATQAGKTQAARKSGGKAELSLYEVARFSWPLTFSNPDDSPYQSCILLPANDHPFGISQVEHIRIPSEEADKIRTRQANATRQLKTILLYQKGRIDDDQLNEALNNPNGRPVGVEVRDDERWEDIFKEINLYKLDPSLATIAQQAADDVRWISGVSEVPWGGAGSATESDNIMQVGSARPNRKNRLFLSFMSRVAGLHRDFLREFAPDGQAVNTVSADGQMLSLQYGREAFEGDYDVTVSPGGEATSISAVQQKMMVETSGMLMGKFGPKFDVLMLREILTKADARNINPLVAAAREFLLAPPAVGPGGPTPPGGPMPPGGQPPPGQRPAINLENYSEGQALRAAANAPHEGAVVK